MLVKTKATQPYESLDQMVRALRLVLPKPRDTWRLVRDPLVGAIEGIPSVAGATIATNGILVLLDDGAGHVQIGHLDHFVVDRSEVDPQFSDLWDGTNKQLKSDAVLASMYAYL